MKNIVQTGLAFILFSFTLQAALQAQNSFDPLVEKTTTSICRVDLTKIDLSQFTLVLSNGANSLIDDIATDAEKAKEMKAMVPMIGLVATQYEPVYLKPLKDAGVTEIFIVGTPENADISPFYLAIPTKDKTKEQIDSLRKRIPAIASQLGMNFRFPFVRHDFLFVPNINREITDDTQIKDYIKNRFKTLDTVKNPIFAETFAASPNACAVQVMLNNEDTMKAFSDALVQLQESVMEQDDENVQKATDIVLNYIKNFNASIKYTTWSLDLNGTPGYYLTFKMNSAEQAGKIQDATAECRNQVKNLVTEMFQKQKKAENAPVVNALLDGMFQFTQDGDTLNWKFDSDFCNANRKAIVDYLKTALAVMEDLQKEMDTDMDE